MPDRQNIPEPYREIAGLWGYRPNIARSVGGQSKAMPRSGRSLPALLTRVPLASQVRPPRAQGKAQTQEMDRAELVRRAVELAVALTEPPALTFVEHEGRQDVVMDKERVNSSAASSTAFPNESARR